MLSEPAAGIINHLLRGADWPRERLAPFGGACLRLEVPPVSATFAIAADGLLSPASKAAEPQAIVHAEPATLFRLVFLRDDSARQLIRVEGDAALAAAFVGVLSNLRWDIEEDLSRVVGDIAAHRAVRTGVAFHRWQVQVISNLASSVAEYTIEEQPLLAGSEALRRFALDVDTLREDVERLEKRIDRLISGARRSAKT